jgi:hypothetical protein
VVAGTSDGTVQAWDLGESSIGHPLHVFQGGASLQFRLPSCVIDHVTIVGLRVR